MPSKARRAFTLVEISVACAIALILSATLGRLFYSSLGWQAQTLRKTSLQQQLKVATQRICAELQESAPSGIVSAPNELCVQRLSDLSIDIPARRYWATVLGVYFVDGAGLHRRDWPPAPPDLGVELTTGMSFQPNPAQMTQLKSGGRSTLLGRNITVLSVTTPQTMPIEVQLTVQFLQQRYSSKRTLSLRNAE